MKNSGLLISSEWPIRCFLQVYQNDIAAEPEVKVRWRGPAMRGDREPGDLPTIFQPNSSGPRGRGSTAGHAGGASTSSGNGGGGCVGDAALGAHHPFGHGVRLQHADSGSRFHTIQWRDQSGWLKRVRSSEGCTNQVRRLDVGYEKRGAQRGGPKWDSHEISSLPQKQLFQVLHSDASACFSHVNNVFLLHCGVKILLHFQLTAEEKKRGGGQYYSSLIFWQLSCRP